MNVKYTNPIIVSVFIINYIYIYNVLGSYRLFTMHVLSVFHTHSVHNLPFTNLNVLSVHNFT
jgi:hypothetical protein